jgi:DNA-binding response OmpR family regulator
LAASRCAVAERGRAGLLDPERHSLLLVARAHMERRERRLPRQSLTVNPTWFRIRRLLESRIMSPRNEDTLVLVADDEPSMLALLSAYIRSKGYRVLEASDGDMAWQLAHQHLPNAVVLDVMMPGMSGWEVCKKIRESVSLAHTGVVMLTGIGESLNELTSPLYGADAYIDKPFEFAELEARIRETLERRRAGTLGRPDSGSDEDEEDEEDDDASLDKDEDDDESDDGDDEDNDRDDDEGDDDDDDSSESAQDSDAEPVTQRFAKDGKRKKAKAARRKPAAASEDDAEADAADSDEDEGAPAVKKVSGKKKASKKKAAKKAAAKKVAVKPAKKAGKKKAAGKKVAAKPAKKAGKKKAAGKKVAAKPAKKAGKKKTTGKAAPAGKKSKKKKGGRR